MRSMRFKYKFGHGDGITEVYKVYKVLNNYL